MGGEGIDVFVSYATADLEHVERIVGDLEAAGLRVWYAERDLPVGASIVSGVSRALSDARHFLVLFSHAARRSRWVREELDAAFFRAMGKAGTYLVPGRLDDCEVPAIVAHRKMADFGRDHRTAVEMVVGAVRADAVARRALELPKVPSSDGDGLADHVLLTSARFGRTFRIPCDLDGTVLALIRRAQAALDLPDRRVDHVLGYEWTYRYAVMVDGRSVGLRVRLGDVVSSGDVVRLRIRASSRDLVTEELDRVRDMMFLITADALAHQMELADRAGDPRRRTKTARRASADSGFAHLAPEKGPIPVVAPPLLLDDA